MKISTILDQIDMGAMALPEFQRGYVWNRNQVRNLMKSLYQQHPVGSLLVWVTETETAEARGDGRLAPGSVKLILDGQQRITSLYGIIRGKEPEFFEGDANAFNGLYFNLDEESFEFYGPMKMKDNPAWISVTELMQKGAGSVMQELVTTPEFTDRLNEYLNRVNAIDNIKQTDFHIDEVTGNDKTIDVVVDIFNNVNSGGTKLSKGDLALAKVCAEWPSAREELNRKLSKWDSAGYKFKLDWLMRCINAIVTGEALFRYLGEVETPEFKDGLLKAERAIDHCLNIISSRLGLDHDRVLGSKGSFPLMVKYVVERGGRIDNAEERDKLLYWYINTLLWGRYAGSTESVLNQDLEAIEDIDAGLDNLIDLLRRNRGDLRLQANDFLGWSRGARFYPLLYMMTRSNHAIDWNTGIELSSHVLGNMNRLEVHHIFPRALLYKHGYERADVNAIANFTFLTKETNLYVSDKNPQAYLEEFVEKNPGAVESHWIPMDRDLWKVENYKEFLRARRELLAESANGFLEGLFAQAPTEAAAPSERVYVDRKPIPGGITSDEEEQVLSQINDWIATVGLPKGELEYELFDEETSEAKAIVDLAWPEGLQSGLSHPVAFLVDENAGLEEIVSQSGYIFFTDFEKFQRYVRAEILASVYETSQTDVEARFSETAEFVRNIVSGLSNLSLKVNPGELRISKSGWQGSLWLKPRKEDYRLVTTGELGSLFDETICRIVGPEHNVSDRGYTTWFFEGEEKIEELLRELARFGTSGASSVG